MAPRSMFPQMGIRLGVNETARTPASAPASGLMARLRSSVGRVCSFLHGGSSERKVGYSQVDSDICALKQKCQELSDRITRVEHEREQAKSDYAIASDERSSFQREADREMMRFWDAGGDVRNIYEPGAGEQRRQRYVKNEAKAMAGASEAENRCWAAIQTAERAQKVIDSTAKELSLTIERLNQALVDAKLEYERWPDRVELG